MDEADNIIEDYSIASSSSKKRKKTEESKRKEEPRDYASEIFSMLEQM